MKIPATMELTKKKKEKKIKIFLKVTQHDDVSDYSLILKRYFKYISQPRGILKKSINVSNFFLQKLENERLFKVVKEKLFFYI